MALPATHTVAVGETLSGIARRYDLTVAALMSLNDLVDPNAIRVGEVLQLTVPEPVDLTVVEPAETLATTPSAEAAATVTAPVIADLPPATHAVADA